MTPAVILIIILIGIVAISLIVGMFAYLSDSPDNGLVYEYQNPANYRIRH